MKVEKAEVFGREELTKMFELVLEEKELKGRDINSIGAHFWTRKAELFSNRTAD